MRLKGEIGGQQAVTVPKHHPLKVGTLSSILDDVQEQTGLSRDDLLQALDL